MPNPVEDMVLFTLGPIPVSRIIVVTWCVMGVVIALAAVVRANLRVRTPGRLQQVVEGMLDWLGAEIRGIVGRPPEPFIPLVASLFIFILAANLTSLVSSLVPGLKPPTADITTTAALSTVVFLAVPFYGVSDVSRTLALAVRLFGNMLSGEILFGVILALVPFFLPLPLMFLSLITGTIQAYIFAVLTIVYIGGAVKVSEKHEAKETAQ